jgi:hypothetical protein
MDEDGRPARRAYCGGTQHSSAGECSGSVDQAEYGPERRRKNVMTADQLSAVLAEQVMGWRVAGDRFLLGNRRWMPLWRFQPATKLADALRLLEKAAPREYSMRSDKAGVFRVTVQIDRRVGEAISRSKARAIAYAVARAFGIQLPKAQ